MFDGKLSKLKFGGKTDNAQIPTNLINKLNELFLPLTPKFIELFKMKAIV